MFKRSAISFLLILLAGFVGERLFAQKIAKNASHHHCCYLNQIIIEGETNINQFNFKFDNSRYVIVPVNDKTRNNKEFIEFEIPVKGFKGENYLMENDFYKLLDAANYPVIVVEIEKIILQKILMQSIEPAIDFYITIAGITKHIKGEYEILSQNDNTILSGESKVRLTDFSLDPPQKMMGMLKVRDVIFIKFDISLSSNLNLVKL